MQKKLKFATFFAAFFVVCVFSAKYFFTSIGSLAFHPNYDKEYLTMPDATKSENYNNNIDIQTRNDSNHVDYSKMEIFDYNTPPKEIDQKALKRQSSQKLDYSNNANRVRMLGPEKLDSNGLYVALMQAVGDNDIERAKALIERKAKVNSPDGDTSYAPIFWAISNGNVEILELLIQNGVKVNTPDDNGLFPIHWVVENSANRPYAYRIKEIFDLILNAHPNEINRQDTKNQRTPLMMAVLLNNMKALAYLMDKGANVGIADKDKKDIMDIALDNSCHECILFIKSKQTENEITPLPNFASTFTAPDPIWLPYTTTSKTVNKKTVSSDPNTIVIQGNSLSLPKYKEMQQITLE